ncbi:MAG: YVTN family beta-propeller repeat-containing protein [Alistipes sp.]|nr:YVTN family beta-propeller repeat-containing protein [Alistipes sp.]
MKGLLKLSPIVISVIILLCATTTRQNLRPMYTTGISITADNKMAIANKGTSDVVLLSESGESEQRWEFAESPTGITSYGSNIYVTSSQDEGYITAINLENNNIAYKTATGMGACAPIMSHDGKKVYVLNRYKATVTEVDAASGEVLREAAVLREPCAATLTPDGKYLYVNNFLPAQRADVDYVAADVSVIDCDTFQKIKDIKLSNGSNALRGIACSADGNYIFVSHNLGRFQVPTSQLQQGWMNTNAVSVIDASTQTLIGSMSIDEPDRGAGGVWDIACNSDYLIVSQSGTHEISIIEYAPMIEKLKAYPNHSKMDYDLYFMRGIRTRLPINGNGPRNMTLKDGKLYLPTYFSDTLNIVNISDQQVDFVAYNPHRVESPADIGERAFNDAALCFQNWQSCNGCHPGDGRTDGMNWDLMNDNIGNPKNCKSMLLSFDTPACMISGIRAHAGLAVRAGYKFIQFCDIPEDIAYNVDEYIKSLKPLKSPYLVNGELSEKALAGRKVYEKYGCADCHSGPNYTDMKMHRIGEDVEFEAGWDTPTLREVWRTAPYLFDGRAATMEEVFMVHKHGIDGKISRKDAEALAEYVNSL